MTWSRWGWRAEAHGRFDGGRITSDGGSPLLRELEAQTGIVAAFAECFADSRDPSRTEHSIKELLAQRIFALAQGCEDLNDHDSLRLDPALALADGKEDIEGGGRRRGTRGSGGWGVSAGRWRADFPGRGPIPWRRS